MEDGAGGDIIGQSHLEETHFYRKKNKAFQFYYKRLKCVVVVVVVVIVVVVIVGVYRK